MNLTYTTKSEILDIMEELDQSLHTLHAEATARLCAIGLNRTQAKKVLLFSVSNYLSNMEEYWSTQPIPVSLRDILESIEGIEDKQKDLFNV